MENAQLMESHERKFSDMDPMISFLGRRTLLGLACLVGFVDAAQSTLTDVHMAVPGPSFPVLPLTARQRIGLSFGGHVSAKTSRTDRLDDSSWASVDASPPQVSLGGQLVFRHEAGFWGGEVSLGKFRAKRFALLGMGLGGYDLVRPEWSLLAWGGVGLGTMDLRTTRLVTTRVVTPLDTHGDVGPVSDTTERTERMDEVDSAMQVLTAAAGLAISLRDDQILSPYAALRLQVGPTVPLNASCVMADVGVRSRLRHRVALRAGIGATSYLGSWFHGANLTAHLGLNIVLRTPPEWWAHSRVPQVEVEEAERKAERDRADKAESEQFPAGNGGGN